MTPIESISCLILCIVASILGFIVGLSCGYYFQNKFLFKTLNNQLENTSFFNEDENQ